MSTIDQLVENAQQYAASFDRGSLPTPPAREVAVVTCMDARINIYGLLGLSEGDAHVIRNAGGVVTQDVLRSLTISQRLLGTREIMVVQHTGCGMLTFSGADFTAQLEEETGVRPMWSAETFQDTEQEVRQSLARIAADPFVPHKEQVRGFVYSVTEGTLSEVQQGG